MSLAQGLGLAFCWASQTSLKIQRKKLKLSLSAAVHQFERSDSHGPPANQLRGSGSGLGEKDLRTSSSSTSTLTKNQEKRRPDPPGIVGWWLDLGDCGGGASSWEGGPACGLTLTGDLEFTTKYEQEKGTKFSY